MFNLFNSYYSHHISHFLISLLYFLLQLPFLPKISPPIFYPPSFSSSSSSSSLFLSLILLLFYIFQKPVLVTKGERTSANKTSLLPLVDLACAHYHPLWVIQSPHPAHTYEHTKVIHTMSALFSPHQSEDNKGKERILSRSKNIIIN